ncbi:MAG: CDP-alcohol phosphatidyltransferase family protein [Methyloceanibacter sp.]
MNARLAAVSVHILTASGVVCALLALRAAHAGDWQTMFIWLGVALVVDAVDGPLARYFNVQSILPGFSGERLDLIIDYLTYVVIPAFALTQAGLLPEAFRLPAAMAILLSSLFHVATVHSKTEEGYFVGFPAVWNIVLLYLFALQPPPYVSLAIVGFLVLLTFVPVLCVHPFRVERLRLVTVVITIVWTAAAAVAVANPFPSPLWVQVLLVATAAYLAAVGLSRFLGKSSGR